MSDAAYNTAAQYTWDDATDRFEAALEVAYVSDRSRWGRANPVNLGILAP